MITRPLHVFLNTIKMNVGNSNGLKLPSEVACTRNTCRADLPYNATLCYAMLCYADKLFLEL